ncbi:MAG: SAM-dependent DNA methyltransferase [Rhodothermaceae bacterium]|nr:SAM-dependent DNA methyltransferase [Rhodothermaceae bacterium]MYJ44868.1 SAM-dependent DNA methyltransferase [Rhodothermaceae bacterium]
MRGTIYDLKVLLPHLALPYDKVSEVGKEIADLVNDAAQILAEQLPDRHQELLAHHLLQRSPLNGLRTMMILWLNALLVQQRLAMQKVDVGEINSVSPDSEKKYVDPHKQLNEWRNINKHNWRSIFEPAIVVLDKAASLDPGATSRSLYSLAECVLKIEYAQLGLHISVGAELFPVLSDDRKTAAAFYTRPSTAELLARLTILPADLEEEKWEDPFLFSDHQIADMACGTGTLLRAGYRRVRDLHERYARGESNVACIHMGAMEGGVIGADISPIAAHLTTSSLASLGRGDSYGDTQIGWVEIGGEGSKTGSFEYFTTDKVVDLYTQAGIGTTSGTDTHETVSVEIPTGKVDWILMNPPYTRPRGGQSIFDVAGLSKEERKLVLNRYAKKIAKEPVNGKAGMAAAFLALARHKLKPGGRIGFVLPLTAAFADSWDVTREMIGKYFTDIIAVAVACQPNIQKNSLSADTGMGEMLLVATKKSENDQPKEENKGIRLHCVTLRNPVLREGEAGVIGNAIQHAVGHAVGDTAFYPVKVGDDEIGQACAFTSRDTMTPWSYLGVLSPDLARAAEMLLQGKIATLGGDIEEFGVGMCTIKDLFDVGPTHHLIGHLSGKAKIGAFEFHPVYDHVDAVGRDRALWGADSKTQNHLIVGPTHKGVSHGDGLKDDRKEMRKKSSTLFYARGMRWTSQALLVATTERKCFGGPAWTSLNHGDKRVQKAFSLWANSTPGFLVHWTQGQRTQGGRARTQVNAIFGIPTPDLSQLADDHLNQAVKRFDEIAQLELMPACQSHEDKVREQIDRAVLEMLSVDSDAVDAIIDDYRWKWCNEPTVHGWNKKALSLLAKSDRLM